MHPGGTATPHRRRMVRTELDLLGLGITGLLADDPCHYSPLVLLGSPEATSAVLRDIERHWLQTHGQSEKHPARVLYLDRERLVRDLNEADGDALDQVHRRWISADLVLIDGIAELSSERHFSTLPHLLDRISEAGRRIVCCLPQPHSGTSELPAAIMSRLGSGLMVTVRHPSHIAFADESTPAGPKPSPRRILSATSRHYGLTMDDLVGASRRRTVALARGLAMHLCRQLCGESLASIGRRFSGRDHTTVLHAIRVTQERIERDPDVSQAFSSILTSLGLTPPSNRTR